MPHKAFLHKNSLLDQFKDDHKHTGIIQSMRAEHTWNNPLTRKKRTKKLNGWIKSFDGKNHIRKLSRFNAIQAHRHESIVIGESAMQNEAMSLKGFIENLSNKLVNKYGLEKDVVKNYLNLHTEEMQELLDDKELSLKEKVLFVRSEITGEMDEAKKDNMTYVLSCKVGPNDTTYCLNKYGAWTDHIEDAWEGSDPDSFTDAMKQNFADSIGAEITDLEIISFEKFESKKNEVLVLPNPTIIYKGPIEDAKKACHYVSKILADKGLGWGRVSWQAPKDGEFHYGHPEKDVYTVTLRGSNDLIKDSFAVYKDVFGNDFWNNCDADPQGWVNPQTIDRYDVATPRQESNETDEKLGYEKGHKNSRGDDAPWVIRSHEDNRILASFATEKEAKEHLKRMKQYSKSEAHQDENAKKNFNAMSRLVSKFFNGNNKYYKEGPWHIANGGYDLIAEIYYDNMPVLDIVRGPTIENCTLDFDEFLIACKVLDPVMRTDYGKVPSYKYDDRVFDNLGQVVKYAEADTFCENVLNALENYEYDNKIEDIWTYLTEYYIDTEIPTIEDGVKKIIDEFNLKPDINKKNAKEHLKRMKQYSKVESYELASKEIQVRKPNGTWQRWSVTWPEYVDTHIQDAKDRGWTEVRVVDIKRNENTEDHKKSESLSNEQIKDAVKFAATEAGIEDYLKVDSDGAMSVTVSLPINSDDLKTVRWVINSNDGTITEYLDTEKNLIRDFTDDESLVSMLTLLFQTSRMELRDWFPKKSESLFNKQELEAPVKSYIADVLSDLVVSFYWGEDGAERLVDKYNDVIMTNYMDGDLSAYETAKYINGKENPNPVESKKTKSSKKSESKKSEMRLVRINTIVVPKWLWDAHVFGKDYGDTLTDEEEEILANFEEEYGTKYYLDDEGNESYFSSHNDFDEYGGPCYEIQVFKEK